jgi:hypothetical protein
MSAFDFMMVRCICVVSYPNPDYIPTISDPKKEYLEKEIHIDRSKQKYANITYGELKEIVAKRIRISQNKWSWRLDNCNQTEVIDMVGFGLINASMGIKERAARIKRAINRKEKLYEDRLIRFKELKTKEWTVD